MFEDTRLIKVPSGGGPREVLAETSERPAGAAWSRDGTIVFATTEGLYSVPASGGQPRLLTRPDRERNGKWMVYESDESGRQFEIYVRPFPDVGGRREQISVDGGRFPRWARTGKELFYVDLDGSITAVPFAATPQIRIGQPRKLFTREKPPQGRSGWPYDISPRDGRFIFLDRVLLPATDSTQVSVVLNFFEDLRTLLRP